MKHSYLTKALTLMLTLIFGLLTMSVFAVSADETESDAEYEAKKAAYREKLMADDVTADDLLIGSWVSFYSFEKDSYEYQLDQMCRVRVPGHVQRRGQRRPIAHPPGHHGDQPRLRSRRVGAKHHPPLGHAGRVADAPVALQIILMVHAEVIHANHSSSRHVP